MKFAGLILGLVFLLGCLITGLFGAVGFVGMIGICSGPKMGWGAVWVVILLSLILPAAAARYLPGPWWIAPACFCCLLPLSTLFEIMEGDGGRALAAFSCIFFAFKAARFARTEEPGSSER
jgi:hypothetical protein